MTKLNYDLEVTANWTEELSESEMNIIESNYSKTLNDFLNQVEKEVENNVEDYLMFEEDDNYNINVNIKPKPSDKKEP